MILLESCSKFLRDPTIALKKLCLDLLWRTPRKKETLSLEIRSSSWPSHLSRGGLNIPQKGSNNTGDVLDRLGRHCISADRALAKLARLIQRAMFLSNSCKVNCDKLRLLEGKKSSFIRWSSLINEKGVHKKICPGSSSGSTFHCHWTADCNPKITQRKLGRDASWRWHTLPTFPSVPSSFSFFPRSFFADLSRGETFGAGHYPGPRCHWPSATR